ncbi:hypothetical protein ACSFA8_20885 [Variovorax sp. RT4R15]|uniref:hypothetical protein n=1 Tax=Variovorax sp. RT4R15 TaxID=3443737 RepID=UPI003F45C0FD
MSKTTTTKQAHVLDALIATYPHLLRKGWRKQIALSIPPTEDSDGDAEEFAAFISDLELEPDAVALEPELREVIFFEVEVHNLMSDAKLQRYGKLAIDFLAFEIHFGVMTVNKHGHINEIDMLPHYGAWLKEVQRERLAHH